MELNKKYLVKTTSFSQVRDDVSLFAQTSNLADGFVRRLILVLEELYANTFDHNDAATEITIFLQKSENNLAVEFMDDGLAFDPTQDEADHINDDLEDRPIGHLGLLLVRQLTTDLTYHSDANANHIRFNMPTD